MWRAVPTFLAVATAAGVLATAGAPAAARSDDAPWADAGATVSTRPIPTRGHVVYVAANGRDRGRGTASSPWATVRHALDKVRPGGTIVVYGRHRGRGDGVYPRQSWGTITTPDVTVQAYPGERPRFLGAADVSQGRRTWRRDRHGWHLDLRTDASTGWPENSYPIPEQIRADRPLAGDSRQLFDGEGPSARALTQVAPPAELGRDLAAREFSWEPRGERGGRIRVGADPDGRSLWWSTRQTAVQVAPEGTGATIAGIAFERYAPHHGDTLGAVRILAPEVTLVDVVVRHSAATGIVASGENGTLGRPLRRLRLVRVSALDNGASGAAIGDAAGPGRRDDVRNSVVVDRSRFDRNNRERFDATDCGNGRYCVLAGAKFVRISALTVTGSTFDGNGATGLWCDLYCDGVVVRGNRLRGNAGSGVYVEVSRRATVAGNRIERNGVGGKGGTGRAAADGDRAVGGVKVTGSTEVRVEDNTLVGNRYALVVGADHRTDDRAASWHRDGSGEPSVVLRDNVVEVGRDAAAAERVRVVGRGDAASWLDGLDTGGLVAAANCSDRCQPTRLAQPQTASTVPIASPGPNGE